MHGREWTAEEDSYLFENYANKTNKVISDKLGRSVPSIVHRAKKLGVKKSHEAYERARKETYRRKSMEINAMSKDNVPIGKAYMNEEWLRYMYYEQKFSTIDLAEICGVDNSAIARWMDNYKLQRRSIENITERTREKISIISSKKIGEKASRWNGGRTKDIGGYRLVLERDHPRANRYGYVREHRLVMEFMLGRLLSDVEVVHHRDGNRINNISSNLFLFPNSSVHAKFHAYKKFVNQDIAEEEYLDTVFSTRP